MPIVWTQPENPMWARYASRDGFVFAMVMAGQGPWSPRWLVHLYPSGQSSEAMVDYVGSEAQAKRFVERWAAAHPDQIGRLAKPLGPAHLVKPSIDPFE